MRMMDGDYILNGLYSKVITKGFIFRAREEENEAEAYV